jgi:hypothetical protein
MLNFKTLAFAIATFTLSQGSFASNTSETLKAILEAQPNCQNFVRYDEKNIYLGFGFYRNGVEEPRKPMPGYVRIAPLNGQAPFVIHTDDAAIDLVADQDTLFVLTYTAIEEWSLSQKKRLAEYETYAIAKPLAYMQHAQAMARVGDRLVIAHGRLGVSIFNIKSRHLENQFTLLDSQRPMESIATGVTVQGDQAYILMDSFTLNNPDEPAAFRGLIKLDIKSQSVVLQLDGLDPGADSISSDAHRLIVSFGGQPVWKYSLSNMNTNKLPEPDIRIWNFSIKGNPTGAAALDEKYYYTCFSLPGTPATNGYHKLVPKALNRKALFLD